jgi:hypothetical protein
MLNARAIRFALASGALVALTMTGVQAASIPSATAPTASTGVQTVHNYCYKGYYYVHYCRRWGYDGYGNQYCRKWGHKRQGYCGGGGYEGGGSY